MIRAISFLFILSVLLMSVPSHAQISNGGFEMHTALPDNLGQWQFTEGWGNANSPSGNPDYYHINGTLGGDLPQTPAAWVLPFEGNAVMGLIMTGSQGTNRRTYLTTELETPLEAGSSYIVSFVMTNGLVSDASLAGFGTSHIGVCFTVGEAVQNNQTPLILPAQFELSEVFYDRDWKRITFSFTAEEAYTHLAFGVFRPDNEITIASFEPHAPSIAYYFVDDFSIQYRPPGILQDEVVRGGTDLASVDDALPIESPEEIAPFFVPNAFTPNGDGDNDFFKPIVNSLENYAFSIYSRWGQLIFKTTNLGEGWDGRTPNGDDAGVGVYVWEISHTVNTAEGSLQEVQQRGTVNLIR